MGTCICGKKEKHEIKWYRSTLRQWLLMGREWGGRDCGHEEVELHMWWVWASAILFPVLFYKMDIFHNLKFCSDCLTACAQEY